jgi:type IV secretion system protein VirB5
MGKRRKNMSMTRKLLFAPLALAAVLWAEGARAQLPVIDGTSVAQLVKEVTTAGQQLQQLQNQYNQLVTQYNSLAKLTNFGSQQPQLLSPLNQNPMFQNSGSAMTFLNGAGGLNGQGQISTYAQGMYTQNHIYSSTAPGFIGSEMTRNATSIAALMASAQQLYATAQARISGLSALETQLNTAHDPKDVLDLQARLQSERGFIENQEQQAQSVLAVAQMQQASERQRYQEQRQADIATAISNAQGW